MAEAAFLRDREQGEVRQWTRYTRAEIRRIWERPGAWALDPEAVPAARLHAHPVRTREDAEALTALWLRRCCAFPDTVTLLRGNVLACSLERCADPETTRQRWTRTILAYDLLDGQWDEGGRLFAEEGPFDVDVPRLVRALLEVRAQAAPDQVGAIDCALREGYAGV